MNTPKLLSPARTALLILLLLTNAALLGTAGAKPRKSAQAPAPWHFAVSGDSRNCGDIVMPAIAAGAHQSKAAFYWHLGDLRATYDFDQDYRILHPSGTIIDYQTNAWPDFQRSQIAAFGETPFFVGIGNHETVPPKSREQFTLAFADWLDTPELRAQRLKDDPQDHQVRTYYHWNRDGVDFISLDNATPEQFDAAQLKWVQGVLQRDTNDPEIRAVVVGMHEALPESLAGGHSMSDSPGGEVSGLAVYNLLLSVKKAKAVYVLASHSHFVMEGIFDTPYWQEHGGVLPGWIVGTAGAFRYLLPATAAQAKFAKTHVYGYLLATVRPRGTAAADPIQIGRAHV